MSQQNMRKEPTFGEPSTTSPVENNEAIHGEKGNHQKFAFSLHSNKSPGHTFTPVMKRPTAKQRLSSIEEQVEQKSAMANSSQSTQTKAVPNTGFAFAPVVEEKIEQDALKEQGLAKPKIIVQPTMNTNDTDRVIPTQPQTEKKKPAVNKVHSKYRRLGLVSLLALALLLIFFLLKPNTSETVEQLQEQGNSLPIEFRPVDEAEAKRAEEEAAKAVQEAQAAQQTENTQITNTQTAETAIAQPAQITKTSTSAPKTTSAVAVKPVVPAKSVSEAPKLRVAKVALVANEPVVAEPVKKPISSGSVIYQAETGKAQTTEKIKSAQQPRVKSGIVSTKILTVPKGVSLMQVFRDNNLNISDVNAMSKVNGAVSNLKVGEKVTVRLDKNNRVVEMIIAAGKYTRQADGSYTFK